MRKFMVVPMAGLLLIAAAAPVQAGANVGNFSGSATVAQGGWDVYDKEGGNYESGYIVVARDSSSPETYAEFSQYSEVIVLCSDGGTPDDPSDDTWGPKDSYRYGFGEATLTIGKKGSTATATGTLDVSEGTFDGCTGEETSGDTTSMSFDLSLTATSGTIRESGRGSFKLPGEINSHSSYKSTYRLADGTFHLGDAAQAVSGQFGTVSWTDHTNG